LFLRLLEKQGGILVQHLTVRMKGRDRRAGTVTMRAVWFVPFAAEKLLSDVRSSPRLRLVRGDIRRLEVSGLRLKRPTVEKVVKGVR
jgi:hypothetical protein